MISRPCAPTGQHADMGNEDPGNSAGDGRFKVLGRLSRRPAYLPIIIDFAVDQTYLLVLIPNCIIGVDGSTNGTQIRTSKVRFQMSNHALFNPSEP
jgi:hypothetical protein